MQCSQPHADQRVRSEFHTPPSQFDGCFTTFYRLVLDVEGGGTVTDYLQPEWGNIRFFAGSTPKASLGSTSVSGVPFGATGPSSLPCRFELGTSSVWGIGFLPVGWARFIAADASDFANIVCDGATNPAFTRFNILTGVLTDPTTTVEEQFDHIVETLGALMRPNRDEPKIARVHAALVAGECGSVADLADRCAMSIRTLERVCRRYFGFTPKLLMRRQRFMRSLTAFMLQTKGSGMRWTEAMDAEYHDQAQFTREFREFMTMLPSEYASLEHPILTSFMEARARIWGSAAQTLDAPNRKA
ncbi:MAG: helix-turn-helix domain-containing protein [Pseudomonadota bacterium]